MKKKKGRRRNAVHDNLYPDRPFFNNNVLNNNKKNKKQAVSNEGNTNDLLEKLRFQTDTALHVLNKSHDDVFENSDEEKHGLGGKDFKEEVVKVIKKKKQLRKKNVSTKSRGNKKKIIRNLLLI